MWKTDTYDTDCYLRSALPPLPGTQMDPISLCSLYWGITMWFSSNQWNVIKIDRQYVQDSPWYSFLLVHSYVLWTDIIQPLRQTSKPCAKALRNISSLGPEGLWVSEAAYDLKPPWTMRHIRLWYSTCGVFWWGGGVIATSITFISKCMQWRKIHHSYPLEIFQHLDCAVGKKGRLFQANFLSHFLADV